MNDKRNYFTERARYFVFAFSCLIQAFKGETNLRIQVVAAFIAIAGGIYFCITPAEWLAVSVSIVLVITLELVNSAVEKLCDLVMPQQHPKIKYIKDVMAAAVLLACIL